MTYIERVPELPIETNQLEGGLVDEAVRLLSSWSDNIFGERTAGHFVEPGDSLNSIAAKSLFDSGNENPSDRAIEIEVERLVVANSPAYPSLVFRPNHIEPGWFIRFDKPAVLALDTADRVFNEPVLMDEHGDHTVVARESISGIALQELKRRGLTSVSSADLETEMSRIVANNLERYPSLADNPGHVEVGWKLRLWDYSIGPEPYVDWQPWTVASSGKATIVTKGERVVAGEGAWIIVEPGAQAIAKAGSKAFVYQNARIEEAHAGSLIVAAGGEVVDYGAQILVVDDQARVLPGQF